MKAVVYHGKKDIRLQDWDEPIPGPADLKLRVTYCGICATDIEEWQFGPLYVQHDEPNLITGRMLPLVPGHEIAGQVVEVGRDVDGFSIGDRVAIYDVATCGTCFWCLRGETSSCPHMAVAGMAADGGLAEFVVWPAELCQILPDTVADEEAPFLEPGTVATHAVRRSGARIGDTVAVLGVGTVGMLALQVLSSVGARVIAIDLKHSNLELASLLGADEVVDASQCDVSEQLLDLTNGIGPDIVLETSGSAQAPVQAIQSVRRQGRVVLVGIYSARPQIHFNDIVGFEREVIGSLAGTRRDFETALQLMGSAKMKVGDLITAKIPLERAIQDGFERMLAPEKDVFRILVGSG